MPKKLTTEILVDRLMNLYGDKYKYNLVAYKGMKNNITLVCNIHGEFERMPNRLLYDKLGCPKCLKKVQKHTKETFIKSLPTHITDKYDYTSLSYNGVHIKSAFRCKKHNYLFKQTPLNHSQGHEGCPLCLANTRARLATTQKLNRASSSKKAILYYIKDKNSGFYKIGVTTNTVKDRFGSKYTTLEVIKEVVLPEKEAYSIEESVLNNFSHCRVTLDGFGNGKTEFFTKDILGWDC